MIAAGGTLQLWVCQLHVTAGVHPSSSFLPPGMFSNLVKGLSHIFPSSSHDLVSVAVCGIAFQH